MRVLKKLLKPFYRILRYPVIRLRDAYDARLHDRRAREAAARLRALSPRSILVLCLGNVCRSPYAARVLSRIEPTVRVDSAGFIGPGRTPPEIALEVARAREIDHSDHRSKVVTSGLLAEADAVLVFDRRNAARIRSAPIAPQRVFWLGDFDPVWSGTRAIGDPWGKDRERFERTFERIERCMREVRRNLGPSGNGKRKGSRPRSGERETR